VRYKKQIVIALVATIVLLSIVVAQSINIPSSRTTFQSILMAPSPSYLPQDTVQPSGVNVSVIGTLKAYKIAPVCNLSSPPCAISDTTLFYLVVNGRNYRLIFQNTTIVPLSLIGSSAVVTGLYVTPSTYQAQQYTPYLQFYGDIYVSAISYFQILPQ
jgi:hypothetical protein